MTFGAILKTSPIKALHSFWAILQKFGLVYLFYIWSLFVSKAPFGILGVDRGKLNDIFRTETKAPK